MVTRDGIRQGKRKLAILLSLLLIASLLPLFPLQSAAADESLQAAYDSKIVLLDGREYKAGEALVVVNEAVASLDMNVLSSSPLDSAELLMTTNEIAYTEAMTGEVANTEESVELSTLNTQESVTIKRVTSSELTTEELLETLASDPRVLLVQPNYIYQLDPGSDDVSAFESTVSTQALLDPSETDDLTHYQWGNSNTAEYAQTPEKITEFDINPPSWEAERTTPGSTNATGAIAVVDTGIDYTHPDLKDVMASGLDTLLGYGGSSGYCAVDGLDPSEPMDTQGHGTHCAGIAAGEWNAFGVSGVASGVEVIAVRAADNRGVFSDAWVIKGYEYLADAIGKGVNLKAINNSWGGFIVSPAFSVAVSKLGNLGAISVMASGNDSRDMDTGADTSSSLHTNPYSVVINSSTMGGIASAFSNYGSVTTDNYAPGTGILSTYPQSLARYLPEAIKASSGKNVIYESFSVGSAGKVKTYTDESAALGTEVGNENITSYFDNDGGVKQSWQMEASKLKDDVITARGRQFDSKYFYAYTDVHESQKSEISYLGFHASADGAPASWQGNTRVLFEYSDADGNPDTMWEYGIIMEGSDWTLTSIDIKSLLEANENLTFIGEKLRVRIDFFSLTGNLDEVDAFSIDAFGLGNENSAVPYRYESGTSMAAPAATGAAAVVALSDDPLKTPSEQALERAAKLKGSVRPLASFTDLCATGGALDLSKHVAQDYTPVLDRTVTALNSTNEYELTLQGHFFGADPGTIVLPNNAVQVKNWSDTAITVVLPPTMQSGYHLIQVTNANGYTGQNAFIINLPEYPNPTITKLFEKEYALPTAEQGFSSLTTHASMIGLGGNIYLLPRALSLGAYTTNSLFKLNASSGSWTSIEGFPGLLYSASMATYEGKLLVTGINEGTGAQELYSYNPSSQAWTQLNVTTIPLHASLVNCNDTLYSAGGMVSVAAQKLSPNYTLIAHDIEHNTAQEVATLPVGGPIPQAQTHKDDIIVGDGNHMGTAGTFAMVSTSTGAVTDLTPLLPTLNPLQQNDYGIAPVTAGIVISGATGFSNGVSADDADTYLLDIAGVSTGASFKNFGKRASYAPFFQPASTAYNGMLYVFGVSTTEPGAFILRATAVDTLPQPGDVTPKPPTPTPPTPTPPHANGPVLPETSDGALGVLAAGGVLLMCGIAVLLTARLRGRLWGVTKP